MEISGALVRRLVRAGNGYVFKEGSNVRGRLYVRRVRP